MDVGMDTLVELPHVVDVPDQPCQQLYGTFFPFSIHENGIFAPSCVLTLADDLLLNSKEANPVLLGFDVVHYHDIPSYKEGGRGQQGSSAFAYNFQGYQFWFINQDNRERFMNDPWKFAPAWGGFCSWYVRYSFSLWPMRFFLTNASSVHYSQGGCTRAPSTVALED